MENKNIISYWENFLKICPEAENASYSAWSFGSGKEMANQLLELVLAEKKQGTSSLYDLYLINQEDFPKEGEYSLILNGEGDPKAIIQTKFVEFIPFKLISKAHGFLEGEGDLSLNYWREVHEAFFKKEALEYGLPFTEDSLVVYEIFKLVYSE